jgi:hypothetical protein
VRPQEIAIAKLELPSLLHHNRQIPPQHSSPFKMLSLPTDVQLLVLDYITLKSDLRALCETSKACHDLAVPHLYHSIRLATWQAADFDVRRFLRCVGAGAGRHLRYVRCMTFEGSKPPEEPRSLQILPSAVEQSLKQMKLAKKSDLRYPLVKIETQILAILEMIRRNTLLSFR